MRKIAPTEIFFGHKYVSQQSVTAVKKVKVHIQKNGPRQCFVFFFCFLMYHFGLRLLKNQHIL